MNDDGDADDEDCLIVNIAEGSKESRRQVRKERATRSKKGLHLRRPRGKKFTIFYRYLDI